MGSTQSTWVKNKGAEVATIPVPAKWKWNSPSQKATTVLPGTDSEVDEVRVKSATTNGIHFKTFNIKCSNGLSADFVKSGKCSTLWFDLNTNDPDPCYRETASQEKTASLKRGYKLIMKNSSYYEVIRC